jgi:hypothetical protein
MQAILPHLSSPFLPLVLLVVTLFLFIANIFLVIKLRKIFKGSNAESLEPLIRECVETIKELQERDELLGDHALKLDDRLSQSVRNVSTLRFKAFDSGTSNQSFSIALLNERGDGAVISSLHHRDRVVTYAKPVANYKSEYDLSEEEKHVLTESEKAHKKN